MPNGRNIGVKSSTADKFGELVAGLDAQEYEAALASAAIEHAAVGLTIMGRDGRYLHANEESCRRTGFTHDEYIGKHVWDLAPEFSAEVIEEIWANYDPATPYNFETEVHCKDGTVSPVDVSIRVMDFKGEPVIVAFSVDISERRAAEAALRESEQRFAHAFHGSPVCMAIIDSDGSYLEVNRSWEAHTGYSAEETIGHQVGEILHWAPHADSDLSRDLFTGNELIDGVEAEFARRDGETRIGLLTVEPLEVEGRICVMAAIEDITDRRRAEAESEESLRRLETLTAQTITTMARLVEARDPYTAGHEQRVTQLSVAIGELLGFDLQTRTGIRVAAELHDIGKMVVPAEILAKPGRLGFAEFSLVKGHAKAGFKMLSDIDFPWPVAQIVYQHHERLDGSGYPNGLKDKDILPEARIIAVADVVEAMSAHRPYRPALGIDAALEEIERGRGTLYDDAAVTACLELFRERGFAFE